MISPARRRLLTALGLLLTTLALSSCGGGGGEQSTSSSTAPQAQRGPTADPASKSAPSSPGQEEGPGAKSASRAHQRQIKNPPIAQTRTPGQKAVAPGVPTSKGSDNSIQVFGVEGEESDASKATRSLSAYMAALGAGAWEEACQQASAQFKEQLAQLIEQAKAKEGAEKPEGCAQTLELLLGGARGAATFASQAPTEVLSFRVEAPYAYLIYEDAEGSVRAIAMAEEDGAWKVNVLQPSELQTTTGGTDESQQ